NEAEPHEAPRDQAEILEPARGCKHPRQLARVDVGGAVVLSRLPPVPLEALAVHGNDPTRGAGRALRPKRMMRNGLLIHERDDDPYAMWASAPTRKLGSGLCDHPQVEEERISSRSKPTAHAPRRAGLGDDR